MIQYSKGRVAKQALAGIPEELHADLRGRSGFPGSASHPCHLQRPNGWTRGESRLKPPILQTYVLEPDDMRGSRGLPMPVKIA